MEAALNDMMYYRLKITKKVVIETIDPNCEDSDISDNESVSSIDSDTADDSEIEDENDTSDESDQDDDIGENLLKSKYSPQIRWKEHYLSHYSQMIRELGPLTLLNTDLFESKVD